eukprot:CAMPEP_0113672210 /NCGR_PEP_ID=MMETSP0038_2-20120614/6133_1 /TAXON_ID=2898 /ORGANISM="Cryptomonas paramecium" /LENGTH=212 /DNA_ID=CAMNT_0000588447 /DNA_START=329 /DNA_END=967 /DNA_ORIENTATION=- /assembly_acc=CAM_ASM_000170
MKDFSVTPSCSKGACIINGVVKEDIKPNCRYDKPCASNSRIDPQDSQLQSQFALPDVEDELVWSRLCEVFAYQEVSGKVPAFRKYEKQLAGAYRHFNETWAFIIDPTSCPCYPTCKACVTTLPSDSTSTMDLACMAKGGFSTGGCNYKIRGVTGGAIIFPYNSTGVAPLADSNEPRMCFQYANVYGSLVRDFNLMLVSHPEWQGRFGLAVNT